MYVEDVNDERPVFTQQQYNRLGLRETAGIGTSVIVVRATDPDTGAYSAEVFLPYTVCPQPVESNSNLLVFSAHKHRLKLYKSLFGFHLCTGDE